MKNEDLQKMRNRLTERIKEYIDIIIKEYGPYMPEENLLRLKNITNYDEILKIYDFGDISGYANKENIMMPLCADKIFSMVSKVPGYGLNKEHKPYNSENMVINDNTFMTYIKHLYVSGTDVEGYYEDLLLHEVMHFCGSGGGSAIEEGTNELLTRMLAQKYNLRTNSCGYPKEVKLAYELMQQFGIENMISLAFTGSHQGKLSLLREKVGEDAATLYSNVCLKAEEEFSDKYYRHMSNFKGATGVVKKALFYRNIDYSKVYFLIDEYKEKHKKEEDYYNK